MTALAGDQRGTPRETPASPQRRDYRAALGVDAGLSKSSGVPASSKTGWRNPSEHIDLAREAIGERKVQYAAAHDESFSLLRVRCELRVICDARRLPSQLQS